MQLQYELDEKRLRLMLLYAQKQELYKVDLPVEHVHGDRFVANVSRIVASLPAFIKTKYGINEPIDSTALFAALNSLHAYKTPKKHECAFAVTTEYQESSSAFDEKERVPDIVGYLYGWKSWYLVVSSAKKSPIMSGLGPGKKTLWTPGKPVEAACTRHDCAIIPCLKCACGIYAAKSCANSIGTGPRYLVGRVRLWGRFLEGEKGFRAQYAYPEEFLLYPGQEYLIDTLKEFNVPVSVYSPVRIFTPEEPNHGHR